MLGTTHQNQGILFFSCCGYDEFFRSATFIKPLEINPNLKLSFGGTDCSYDHWWSKFVRDESSIFAEFTALSSFCENRFHWSNVWREISASSEFHQFPVLQKVDFVAWVPVCSINKFTI